MVQRSLFIVVCLLASHFGSAIDAYGQIREEQIVNNSRAVLQEIMTIPAKQIPASMLRDARGVAIIPNMLKGGFVVGVRHGRGVVLVRDDAGSWRPPLFATLTGGSVGWQAGVESTDIVLVFKTRKSVNGLMNGKLTIGVDAAAAAGPVGRQASAATDARLGAEIYSYSRSRGLFAGVSIDGSALQIDHLAGMAYYRGMPNAPSSAVQLINQLASYTGAPPVTMVASQAPAVVPNQTVTLPNAVAPSAVVPQNHEQVRRQLEQSSDALQKLLDDQWKAYLALPREIYIPNQPVNGNVIAKCVRNYETVAGDASFRELATRPEFKATLRLLRQYASLPATAKADAINLPPPPGGGAASAAPGGNRYE